MSAATGKRQHEIYQRVRWKLFIMWENEVLVGDLMRETVNSVAGGWWEETHPARHRIPIVGRRVVASGITRQLV